MSESARRERERERVVSLSSKYINFVVCILVYVVNLSIFRFFHIFKPDNSIYYIVLRYSPQVFRLTICQKKFRKTRCKFYTALLMASTAKFIIIVNWNDRFRTSGIASGIAGSCERQSRARRDTWCPTLHFHRVATRREVVEEALPRGRTATDERRG